MNKIFLLLILLFVGLIIVVYKDYGISWDEPYYLDYGKKYVSYFFDPEKIRTELDKNHSLAHGAIFDVIYYLPIKALHLENSFEFLHLEKAFYSSLVLVFVFFATLTISKNHLASLIAVLLMIATPRWFGDIFDNHVDGVSAIIYAALIFLSLKLLSVDKEKFIKYFIVFALVSTIAFSHRVILFFLPLLTLALLFFKSYKNKTAEFLKLTLIFSAIFVSTLLVIDPAVRSYGLNGLFGKLYYSARYVYGRTNLFNGIFYGARNLPWYYLPTWIAITTPIVTVVLFLLGSFGILGRLNKISIFLLVSFYAPLILAMVLRPVMYDGWRQFLFLAVPLNMIATLGVGQLIYKKWVLLVILVLLGNVMINMMRLHPYEYVYFNSLVGGLKGAYGKYETDYWGKSYKEAVEWLKLNEIKDKNKIYKIYSCDNTFSSSYYFTKNMKLEKDLIKADYAVCFTRWNDHKKIPGKVIYVVEREGIPLNKVFYLK